MNDKEAIKFLYNQIEFIHDYINKSIDKCTKIRANKCITVNERERKIYATIMIAALNVDDFITEIKHLPQMKCIKDIINE